MSEKVVPYPEFLARKRQKDKERRLATAGKILLPIKREIAPVIPIDKYRRAKIVFTPRGGGDAA